MGRKSLIAAAGLMLATAAFPVVAQAQGRLPGQYFDPSREAPPLVVRKHLPFTDSGTNAPVGYEHEYMVDQTQTYLPVYSSFRPDSFGQDVLPGRFGEIGRGAY